MSDNYLKEYGKLYKDAQKNGQYKMFLFDVIESKKWAAIDGYFFRDKMMEFINSVTKDILDMEKKLNKKILHRHMENMDNYDKETDKDKVVLYEKSKSNSNIHRIYRADCLNPNFFLGDLIYFILIRDSITDEEFYDIFQKNKEKFIPKYDFHHKSGYYETDVWSESNQKFSRIYCLPILEQLSKLSKTTIQPIKNR